MNPLAFVDCETTHLSPEVGEVWEVAIIRRDPDGDHEYVWQFAPLRLDTEHEEALAVGRYRDRFIVPAHADAAYISHSGHTPLPMTRAHATHDITRLLKGVTIAASNAAFDDHHLRKLLNTTTQPWHYRPLCVATYAEGYLRGIDPTWVAAQTAPISSHALSRRLGVEPPGPDQAHQALPDARWHRDMYDAVVGGAR